MQAELVHEEVEDKCKTDAEHQTDSIEEVLPGRHLFLVHTYEEAEDHNGHRHRDVGLVDADTAADH